MLTSIVRSAKDKGELWYLAHSLLVDLIHETANLVSIGISNRVKLPNKGVETMPISTVKMMDICQSRLTEALLWHEVNSNSSEKEKGAFRAGYLQGFREALATVRLHGYERKEK